MRLEKQPDYDSKDNGSNTFWEHFQLVNLVVHVKQNCHEEPDNDEEEEPKSNDFFILVVVLIDKCITEILGIISRIFTETPSFPIHAVITNSTCTTENVVDRMLWTWVTMRSIVALCTFFTSPPNEIVWASAQVLLVVLVDS